MASAGGGFTTCLADDSRVLADARVVTAAADVLAEDPEGVLVAHDQVGHGAAGPAVVLVDGEPLLEAQRESRSCPIRKPAAGFLDRVLVPPWSSGQPSLSCSP